jgi:outer membrane receptor protein involved in Fe transport
MYRATIRRRAARRGSLLGASAIAIIAAGDLGFAQDQSTPPATAPAPTVPPAGSPATPPAPAAPSAETPGATTIPEITVTAPKPAAAPAARSAARPAAALAGRPAATTPTQPSAQQAAATAARQYNQQIQTFDQQRAAINPPTGTSTETKTQQDIENLPQGSNTQPRDVFLQYPGVSQDSASSGDFHVRNEHANVQFRVNGILLPDGVSGYSQFLDTTFIKSMTLITGALPAQYGLRTAGVLDITAKNGSELQGGNIGVYGGSRQTFSNFFEYGGVKGNTEYFAVGRYYSSGLGLENPFNGLNAFHDHTELGRFFSYTSTVLNPENRISTITGMSVQRFQIPDNPGQPVNAGNFSGVGGAPYSAFGMTAGNSLNLNENQYETNAFGVVAWQHSAGDVDAQLSYFSRYSSVHFVPDVPNDLLFNNVATDVLRTSLLNGVQGDVAYKVTNVHTIRTGFVASGEQTQVKNLTTVEPLDAAGEAIDNPTNIANGVNKFGWLFGSYIQDEWKVTSKLTLNTGVRFDEMVQFVDKNQVSPRFNLVYNPFWGTVFHTGYARNFTPPPQVLGQVYQAQYFNNTTNAATVGNFGPILPERSTVVDAGITQQLLPPCPSGTAGLFSKAPVAGTNCPALEVGVDAYYKRATDLLDDGQFGQAYVLTAFNYAKAENWGIEAKAKFSVGHFTAYTNWAVAYQHANTIVSNQALFTPDELAYIANNWVNTDHAQTVTGSAGVSYLWDRGTNSWIDGTKISASMIYGSGLRQGFANTDHLPAYGQVNLGLSKEFKDAGWDAKPVTVRFDVVNLFDTIYEIRSGTGIGVFAPQFGPRRGYYFGISQKL